MDLEASQRVQQKKGFSFIERSKQGQKEGGSGDLGRMKGQ